MESKYLPEQLFDLGFTGLVSVIPPGAQLTPKSKITPGQLGKVPGRRLANGLWAGYDWRKHEATAEDVHRWVHEGANVGLRADYFPGVDIDCTDERLAGIIESAALAKLGPAPVRIGRAPKRLLMYRTSEPFSRMRLWVERKDDHHLVEVLGQGQQYLVYGTHPATLRAYEWIGDPTIDGALTEITREKADEFLTYLGEMLDMLSVGKISREGDGRNIVRTAAGNQEGLEAPSIEKLAEAVRMTPNTNDLFRDRESYIKMGYAIRAAAGGEEDAGFDIFSEWASRWDGGVNDPDVVLADWRRIRGPYAVGWSFLAEQARAFGFNDAVDDFDVLAGAPAPDDRELGAPFLSDQWLALKVVEKRRAELRFVPAQDRWLVWDRARWVPDAALLAEDMVKHELRKIADKIKQMGSTPAEIKEFEKQAINICSAGKATAVRSLVQSDRAIAVEASTLDFNPWILNTPAGLVDLRTGIVGPADPDQLSTRATVVSPDFGGACPEWRRFLAEATGGSVEMEQYLQRLAGYSLTGSTREQTLTFIWGPGGNGKSVFLNVLTGILGDYARIATMDTFVASHNDKHSTDIAMLQGARLVTASETQSGKRWDEAKVKSMTGGEPITARFMRQDNFTYLPQFKLVFVGNHKPEIRDVDAAMRRRIHLVPFVVTPARIDRELAAKLREEWPAILAWMIQGCLAWQQDGLVPPEIVRATTEEYFRDEDAVGRWMEECTEVSDHAELTADLFQSWKEWANRNGEYVGSTRRFSQALITRKLARWKHPENRRAGFAGITLKPAGDILGVV
jgi:P4 family phage/plasmid primase-like protien